MKYFFHRILADDLVYDENILNGYEAAALIIISAMNAFLVAYEIFNL